MSPWTPPPLPIGPPTSSPATLFDGGWDNDLRVGRFVGAWFLPLVIRTHVFALDGNQGDSSHYVRFVRPRIGQVAVARIDRFLTDDDGLVLRDDFDVPLEDEKNLPGSIYEFNITITVECAQDLHMDRGYVTKTVSINNANEGGWIPCSIKGKFAQVELAMEAPRKHLSKSIEGIDLMFDEGEESP